MKKKIIIIGTGGHSSSIIDLIESTKKFIILGFLCNKNKVGSYYLNYKILGNDNYLIEIKKKPLIVLGFSSYKNLSYYKKQYLKIKSMGFKIPNLISPFSYVSKNSSIGQGVNIFHGAIVNNNCLIGNGVTINSRALIEHDCVIDDFCHISTGCILNGGVRVNKKTFIGSGSIIRENIKIFKKKFIKISSLITNNI
jgi:sugar O-acyltransferase (sialic acid O-acetyltransferase NeuD family)